MSPITVAPGQGLPTPARYPAMAVVILGITMSVLDSSILNLALPKIARELEISAAHTVWIVNAYQVAILAFLLPLATLGDRIGYRRVYLGGLALFTAASLACAFAPSLPALAAARAVQGLGASGIMSVNPAIVRLIYPRQLIGRGVAINSMVVAAAAVAGPSIAALILSVASWPWLFAVNLPIGLVVVWLGLRVLPANGSAAPAEARLSGVDVALNAAMFGLVFLGADTLGKRPDVGQSIWENIGGLGLLGAGLVVGVVYLRRQLRQPLPIFPVDLLRIPVFALSMCSSVTTFAAQTLSYIALPFLLLDAYGLSPVQAGLLITAWPLAIVAAAPLAGFLIGRYPDGLLGGVGLALMSLGLLLLALLPAQPSHANIVWRLILCGAGFGLFQSPNNHTIVTSAPEARSGGAGGMLASARLTGQTIGAVILAIIFSFVTTHDGRGSVIALGIGAALAALGAVFSSLRLRTVPTSHKPGDDPGPDHD